MYFLILTLSYNTLYLLALCALFWLYDSDICSCSLIVFFYFFINLFILFIYFWLHWVFVAAHGLSLVAASGCYSCLQCAGFLLQWLLLLWSTGSRRVGFSGCGMWAQ